MDRTLPRMSDYFLALQTLLLKIVVSGCSLHNKQFFSGTYNYTSLALLHLKKLSLLF